jgi:hypothetical protein
MRSPSPDLLQLGRGIVRWARITSGVRGNFIDMGNVEALTIATADTKLTKKSSRIAANVIYKEITSEREVTVTIQGDEFNEEVLAALLQGNIESVGASAGGSVVEEPLAAADDFELDVLFKLAHPLVSSVVLKNIAPDTPATYTEGTDYEVTDAARGFIRIFSAAEGGTIDVTAGLVADYDWAVAVAHKRIRAGTEVVVEAAIRFAADNAQGPNRDAEFYRCSLTSDGDLGLIQNEFGTWTLKCKLLDDSAGLFGGSTSSPLYKLIDAPSLAP